MADYTLISIVGTGMYKKEGGYRSTTYVFPNGKEFTTNYFLRALFETKYRQIKKIILVGTRTSSWDILVDENDCDFWCKVKDECEGNGISDDNVKILQKKLTDRFHLPVIVKVHNSKIDSDTTEEVFSTYKSIASEILPNTKILFDITHGFRSMPILIYQALQYNSVNNNIPSVELVYGEYVDQKQKSYVRDLSKYWELSEITIAINKFNAKLDGRMLAEKIKDLCPSCAKALVRFSDIVEMNYSLQIPEFLKQLKNTLNDMNQIQNPTITWLQTIKENLEDIYNKLSKDKTSRILYSYALLLEEKGLTTQAVIALQVSAETAVTEKFASEEYFGDYDWWQSYGKSEYENIKKQYKQLTGPLWEIEKLRNGIAHGGAKDKRTGEYPSCTNIPNILKNGKKAVTELFNILDKN